MIMLPSVSDILRQLPADPAPLTPPNASFPSLPKLAIPLSSMHTLPSPLLSPSSPVSCSSLASSPLSLPSAPSSPCSMSSSSSSYSHRTTTGSKRKRATPAQVRVLNHVFSHTYFPSSELRMRLSQQLGMSPRTVQIWFQNKRQALKRPTSSRMYTAPQKPIMTLPPLQLVAPPTASYTLSMPSPYCF